MRATAPAGMLAAVSIQALKPSLRCHAFMVHVAIVLAVALTATGVCARSAAADVTVHVSTVKDQTVQDSQCSLREAVQYATVAPEPDCASGPPSGVVTILVPPGCYRLHGALLFFGNPQVSVVITGSGRGPADCAGDGTVIDAQQSGSVLQLAGSINVTVSDLTLTGGLSCTSCGGGGIANGGNLALDHVTITGNAAAPGADQSTPGTGAAGGVGAGGGGIWNMPSGQLTVTDSSIVGNAAGAGGAGSDGSGDNGGPGGAGGSGGGIFNAGGVVTVSGSTISGNTAGAGGGGGLGDPNATPATAGGQGGAGGDGGGIATIAAGGNAGRLTVRNSTVAGNFAGSEGAGGLGSPSGAAGLPGGGGGIRATSATLLANVTVAGNSASGTGDGVDAAGGTLTEFGSIIAANGLTPTEPSRAWM